MKVKVPPGARREPAHKPGRKRGTIRCAQCGSHRLFQEMGFIGGAKYTCADCGFRGGLVVTDDAETAANEARAADAAQAARAAKSAKSAKAVKGANGATEAKGATGAKRRRRGR